MAKTFRPDRDGTHRGMFDKNKKKIYATQTVCGICGMPVDFSLRYPHPLSPCIDHYPSEQRRTPVRLRQSSTCPLDLQQAEVG